MSVSLPPESGSPALLVQLRTWRTQVTVWHDTCFWHLRVNSIVSHASSEGPGQKAVSSQGDPSFHSAAPAPKVRESPESRGMRSEYHAAVRMVIASMLARASTGVR